MHKQSVDKSEPGLSPEDSSPCFCRCPEFWLLSVWSEFPCTLSEPLPSLSNLSPLVFLLSVPHQAYGKVFYRFVLRWVKSKCKNFNVQCELIRSEAPCGWSVLSVKPGSVLSINQYSQENVIFLFVAFNMLTGKISFKKYASMSITQSCNNYICRITHYASDKCCNRPFS